MLKKGITNRRDRIAADESDNLGSSLTAMVKRTFKATLDMAAGLGRTIMVVLDGEDYRAMAEINGVTSYVDKLFIHASGEGLSTRVEYIELHGISVQDHSKQYERFTP